MSDVYHLTPLEVAVLLVNLHQAAQDPEIGHQDHVLGLRQLTQRLSHSTRIRVKKEHLESALWACNMRAEKGTFWSPYVEVTTSFDDFLNGIRLGKGERFDKFYNTIDKKVK